MSNKTNKTTKIYKQENRQSYSNVNVEFKTAKNGGLVLICEAQAIGDNENKAIMVENIISTMSINMRTLLSQA